MNLVLLTLAAKRQAAGTQGPPFFDLMTYVPRRDAYLELLMI